MKSQNNKPWEVRRESRHVNEVIANRCLRPNNEIATELPSLTTQPSE
jgi:hypothetical protein